MRHVKLDELLAQVFAGKAGTRVSERLSRATKKLAGMAQELRKPHTDRNGANKWKPVKDGLTNILGSKCWYTELELIGAPLAVDHYRPVHDYLWLAFDADNYRLACPWSNSPTHNPLYGCAGGKGEMFPLLPPATRATEKSELANERPVILDPCNEFDCKLLAFQSDGRPVLNPHFSGDATASLRVERSKILLNLDHPAFNSQREQLYQEISEAVRAYEDLPATSATRGIILTRLGRKLAPNAQFSVAARFYLGTHRHLDWVEDLLNLP